MRARAAPTERCARPRPAWSRARASRNSAPPHAQPHSAVPFLPLTCLSAAMRVRLASDRAPSVIRKIGYCGLRGGALGPDRMARLTRYLFPREGDELLKSF